MRYSPETIFLALILASASTFTTAENSVNFFQCPDLRSLDSFKDVVMNFSAVDNDLVGGELHFNHLDLINLKDIFHKFKYVYKPWGFSSLIYFEGTIDADCFGVNGYNYTAGISASFCNSHEDCFFRDKKEAGSFNRAEGSLYGVHSVFVKGAIEDSSFLGEDNTLLGLCVDKPSVLPSKFLMESLYKKCGFWPEVYINPLEQHLLALGITMGIENFWNADCGCSLNYLLEAVVGGLVEAADVDVFTKYMTMDPSLVPNFECKHTIDCSCNNDFFGCHWSP